MFPRQFVSVGDILLHFSLLCGNYPVYQARNLGGFACLFVDVYTGRHIEILQRRKEAKNRTLQARRYYNRAIREQGSSL